MSKIKCFLCNTSDQVSISRKQYYETKTLARFLINLMTPGKKLSDDNQTVGPCLK